MSMETRPAPPGRADSDESPAPPARGSKRPALSRGLRRRIARGGAPTLGVIFLLAFALRAAWAFGVAEPPQYSHPYQYLSHSLWLAQRPDAWSVVWNYDNWRVHYDRWTAAPLYYLFLLGIFRLAGPSVFWVRLIQCALGGLAAVSTARIGSRIGGSRGRWAGVAFALHLPLIQICATTLTESLYVPLMMLAFDLLLRSPSRARALLAGLTQGVAALTRSVSSAFFAIMAVWLLRKEGLRRGLPRAALLALGGMLTILPWAARNYFVMGEPVLIETFAWENLWYANALVDGEVKRAQRQDIVAQKTTAEQRDRAVELTIQNLRLRPDLIPGKIWVNLRHLLRPEGLHQWLTLRSDESMGRLALQVLLEDALYLVAWLGLALFLFRKRWNHASTLALLWLAYSLLMVVVFFQNEVRYRIQIAPFLFATGIAGWFGPGGMRRSTGRAWIGRVMAALILLLALAPYPAQGLAVIRARLDAHNLSVTEPRPGINGHAFWTERFQTLTEAGHVGSAAEVVERLGDRAPLPVLTLAPRILLLLGAEHEVAARAAWSRTARIEWTFDETRVQSIAWRRRPSVVRTDRIQIGSFDLGLISGFGPPLPQGASPRFPKEDTAPGDDRESTSRWTRGHSRLRLCAPSSGPATLTLRMAAPLPAPHVPMSVSIRFQGRVAGTAPVGREPADYEFKVQASECPAVVDIGSAVWSGAEPPAELGVLVFSAGLTNR